MIKSLTSWNLALKKKPSCGKYHLLKGIVLWEMPSSDKLEAYGAFLEVPMNGIEAWRSYHVT